eukprot:m.1129297 g.1129297  ORF g.1129297 m.1129297 type:complete len:492 (-) comp24417_c0_seq2:2235-3710(-)
MESPSSITDLGELLDDDDEFLNMIDSIEDRKESPTSPHVSKRRRKTALSSPIESSASSKPEISSAPSDRMMHPVRDLDNNTPLVRHQNSISSATSLPTFDDDSPHPKKSHLHHDSSYRQAHRKTPSGVVNTTVSPPLSISDVAPGGSAKRRFPGPAGILPRLMSSNQLAGGKEGGRRVTAKWTALQQQAQEQRQPQSPRPDNSPDAHSFESGAWITMLQAMKGFTGYRGGKGTEVRMKHSIATVLHGGSRGKKVPMMCVMIKRFSLSDSDASITLIDPSGEMMGTLHRGVFDKQAPEEFCPGAVLVLKQVAVFSPAPKRHYLNITPNNILRLFPSETLRPTATAPRESPRTAAHNLSTPARPASQSTRGVAHAKPTGNPPPSQLRGGTFAAESTPSHGGPELHDSPQGTPSAQGGLRKYAHHISADGPLRPVVTPQSAMERTSDSSHATPAAPAVQNVGAGRSLAAERETLSEDPFAELLDGLDDDAFADE